MKLVRRSLIALAGLPLTFRARCARGISPAWSEWETFRSRMRPAAIDGPLTSLRNVVF